MNLSINKMPPMKIVKSWGWEYIFVNNELYCGKLIYIENDKWSSKGKFHYHKNKDETFFVLDGVLMLQIIVSGETKTINLPAFTNIRLGPTVRHRFTTQSGPGCRFIEVSTHHDDEDSYYEDR